MRLANALWRRVRLCFQGVAGGLFDTHGTSLLACYLPCIFPHLITHLAYATLVIR